MEWTILFKALAPLAGRAAATMAPSLIRTWRVAFETTRRAKKDGVRVKFFALRSFIDAENVFITFHDPSAANMDALTPGLKACIRHDGDSDSREIVAVVLAHLASAYVHSLPPAQASRLEGEHTRGHVTREISRLQEDGADRKFEENCEFLNPYRAEDARPIYTQWPAIARAVAAIVTSQDRGQILRDWSTRRPEWLADAPASALCWLSFVAIDYGASDAARVFLIEAIAAGASPRSYWQARLVLAASLPRDEAEEMLDQAQDHPLAAALLADLHGNQQQALEHIRSWKPTLPEGRATKSLILAQLLTSLDDLESAIDVSLNGYEEYGSTGCALYAAKLLLGRGSLRKHPAFMSDLAKGLDLADAVRVSRRAWGGNSAEAAVVMMGAYTLLGSPEESWRTGTALPEGTANAVEAGDPNVVFEVARLAAELGMDQQARELMAEIEEGPQKNHIEAILVQAESGAEGAIPIWTAMLGSTTDPAEALNIGLQLAHNAQEIEWPSWVKDRFPVEVDDIELISALFRSIPGALQKARSRAATSRQVFHGLMSFHDSAGRYLEAAEVAESGGKRWNDPEAWLGAAEYYLKANNRDRAIQAAEEAVRVGGTSWKRERRARIILIENRSSQGHWDQALIEATRLFELDPTDDSKWAFLTCQYMTADYQGAWDSLQRFKSLSPRTPDDARLWIQLNSRFAAAMNYLQEAAMYAGRWSDNEQLRATIVVSLMQCNAKPASDDQVALYQELIARFIEDFPESSIFRSFSIDENNPVEFIRTLLLEQLESRDVALQPILDGELPLGMATNLSGKSYAEICLIRGAGRVFAGDPSTVEEEVSVVLGNLDKRVVIDISALSTLSILESQVPRELVGLFASSVLPTASLHDVQTAAASLSTKSTESIGIDRTSGTLRISKISEDEADRRAQRAETMFALGKEFDAVSHPQVVQLPGLDAGVAQFRWLLALDLAKSLGLPFWCDDKVLRSLARTVGVESFGTPALLEAMRRQKSMTFRDIELCEAELVRNYYTGIQFTPSMMELAAEMDGWMPLGVAAAISEAGPTTSPETLIAFVLRALRRCKTHPEAIQAWVSVGATWLDSVSADTDSATYNLRLWFARILQQEWISSTSLPFVLSGLRAVTTQRADMDRIVPEVLGQYYSEVADQTDHATAALYVRDLVQQVPGSDRSAVLQQIIGQ